MDPLAIYRMNLFYGILEKTRAMPEVLFISMPPGSGYAPMNGIFGNEITQELINEIRKALDVYEKGLLIIKNKSNEQKSNPKDN